MGVGALLGLQAVPCALLELYGCKQSRKRPLQEGNTGLLKMYSSVTAFTVSKLMQVLNISLLFRTFVSYLYQ